MYMFTHKRLWTQGCSSTLAFGQRDVRKRPRWKLSRLPCKQDWAHIPKISASSAGNFGMLPACVLRGRVRNYITSRSAATNSTAGRLTEVGKNYSMDYFLLSWHWSEDNRTVVTAASQPSELSTAYICASPLTLPPAPPARAVVT